MRLDSPQRSILGICNSILFLFQRSSGFVYFEDVADSFIFSFFRSCAVSSGFFMIFWGGSVSFMLESLVILDYIRSCCLAAKSCPTLL